MAVRVAVRAHSHHEPSDPLTLCTSCDSAAVRQALGMATGATVKVTPSQAADAGLTVFVQSTSPNRKLADGQTVAVAADTPGASTSPNAVGGGGGGDAGAGATVPVVQGAPPGLVHSSEAVAWCPWFVVAELEEVGLTMKPVPGEGDPQMYCDEAVPAGQVSKLLAGVRRAASSAQWSAPRRYVEGENECTEFTSPDGVRCRDSCRCVCWSNGCGVLPGVCCRRCDCARSWSRAGTTRTM